MNGGRRSLCLRVILDAFLGKARRIAPRGGERTLCRDGSSW